MSLLEYILVCMLILAPGRFHLRLALAVERAVEEAPALFKDDGPAEVAGVMLPAKSRTAALVVAIGYRESGLEPAKTGDCAGLAPGDQTCTKAKGARAFGAFQRALHGKQKTEEGMDADQLLRDPEAQARLALSMLRASVKACPEYPVAYYAHGLDPRDACADLRSQRISNDRVWLAKKTRGDAARRMNR